MSVELAQSVITTSPEETERTGALLGQHLLSGDIVPLIGNMGAGKTCFVNGVARGLGVPRHVPVTSPSFTLINRYEGNIPIFHIDLYRLSGDDNLDDLELEEIFTGDGIVLMEWPQVALPRLPRVTLEIYFDWDMSEQFTRQILFKTSEPRFAAFFKELDNVDSGN